MTNKTKLLSLVFGITMCLALMLGIAMASPTSTVYAEGGTGTTGGLTIGGTGDIIGTGYSYEGSTQTLTLQNYNGKEIEFSGSTIKVEGNNTITVDKTSKTFNAFGYSYYVGIGSLGAITITGSGSLAFNIDKTDITNSAYGIWTNGDLTINGGNITIGKDIDNGRWGTGLYSDDGSISVVGKASLDVTTTYSAINASKGNITLAGEGNKKILINKEGKNFQADGIRAGGGKVDISGVDSPDKGKVTCLFSNSGGGIDTAIFAKKQIKIHSKADVEVSAKISSSFAVSSGSPAVEISGSKVKTTTIDVGTTSFIQILDSNVTAATTLSYPAQTTVSKKLEIAGKSTVYFSSKEGIPIAPATEEVLFRLSDGGSITMVSNYMYADTPSQEITLGAGTVMETGIKVELIANPGTWVYGFQYKNPGILRFVHSATEPASAIADDVTISGITDAVLTEQDIKLTLTGDNFKAIAKDTDVTSWFKNMPKGLSAKVKADVAAGATEMTITISGTPTEASSAFILIEIPVGTLQTATYSLIVQTTNIKFDIVSGTPVDVPTAATGYVYDGAVKIGISEPADKSYTVTNGSAINAGTHTATLTLNKGFKWSDGSTEPKTVTWEIARMPDVEIEVTLTQTEYEYTGLEISAYFTITIKGTDKIIDKSECDISYTNNKEVGEATVKIEDNGKGNYAIKNTVTKNFTIVKRTTGEPTGLTGVAPSADGALDGKITGTTAAMEYSTDKEFTSPQDCKNGETAGLGEGTYYVRYKATPTTAASNWVAVHVRLNTVTVVDANTKVTKHKSGTNVTVTVTIPTGKSFIKWVYEGVTIPTEDVTKQEITFTMPEKDVKLTALFDDIIYNITVTDGTSSVPTAKYEKEITVTANAPATGKEFDKWVVSGITLSDEDLAKSTVGFKMPASDVTMEATYKDVVYQVTVTNGTATPEMAKYQAEVTVKANEPAPDMYFDKWEVTGLDTTGMDLTKTEIKFPMPAGNVTFKATYLTIEKFEIVVVDGTKDKEVAKAGETIAITANPAPAGKVFDKWTCETAGVTIEFANATNSKTTFVMPASNIKIQAHFRAVESKPSVEIKVNGGTGAGTYKQGDSVTVTANDPAEGKVFKGWKDESGAIVSTEKSYTFTVNGETTLTAVYGDKPSDGGEITPPAEKDGLSGGAIAGIVIGSVAVAGIGGFAIFWFAVRKKTFADLIAVIKGTFKNK